ncbi:two-component system, chemotaxis family, sensor kinase CheA [Alkalithermobacter thermoalcaliphilus JW-YL-7 = DSM 7308]|uniref:Chemotaxis protein CheA n=1 Tax=Alkalithermobacter thermoalcaliphilus JW-YL-7 = DSM 7308 TaxID=1121328 RepID=A0A150FRY3_CLOPD|nr:CheA signal transduction histidine kinase [[Clostridium] paradoxum JW-YL-7 = DSM 7308]SHK60415.1 two-component system, chemotaxis family, sensor kinase CheA [[Clostridium] paradoxum JW-YL-7 = DSM 7308]
MFDLEQYLDMFLDESKEHLENLNRNLLKLEEDHSIETVNEIFRIAHTLKGMSSTMGFEKIATLTHKMENVLDDIRAGKLKITTAIIDLLFEGLDILDEFVKNIEAEGKESDRSIDNIINNLCNLNDVETTDSEKDSSSQLQDDFQYVTSIAQKAKDQGINCYEINVKLEESCILKAARAFLVFKAVEQNGEIIYSNPSTEDIEDENFSDNFNIIALTKLKKEDFKEKILAISEIKDVTIKDFDKDSINLDQVKNLTVNTGNKIQQNNEQNIESKNDQSESKQRKGKTSKTVRVDIDRLDNLMNLVSELIIVKTRLEDIDTDLKGQNMNEAIEYLERITTSLHDAVTKVRMVPIERVFNRFPRMVRDLSKELNKEINLIMEGEETEVDRTVIDEIGDPLIHLLRNSIDHGIETPEVRKSLGKSEVGTTKLIAYPDGNNVVIEVCDDGSGLNIEKIKKKALEKNIITKEQAEIMDDKEAAKLIFAPGFSTADKISDISGRGVGLDVVKTKIEALGGTVEIESEKNKGSKFIIRLPLTLAIIQALLVTVEDEKYAIPLNNIKEITSISTDNIRIVEGKEIVLYRGKTLPLINLGNVLDVERKSENNSKEIIVVIVKKGDKDLGLIVDNLIGQQEIVIKSLGKYLSGLSFIAGATILGNGSVALIIDTNSLFQREWYS